jgi:hypothetical protein
MNIITNYGLNNSLNFGNAKKEVAEKAVQSLDKALQIANKNPKTHNIYFSSEPDIGRVINICRHTSDNIRNAMYNPRTGELIKAERTYLGNNGEIKEVYDKDIRGLLEYDTKGNYKGKHWTANSLENLINWCKYTVKEFREASKG